MENAQQQENAPAHGSAAFVKLHAPALWFLQVECLFHVKQITDQFQKYCHVVGSLPHESLRQVADIVEAPPAETPYIAIKQRLMAAHQLTSFQRAEKLFAMPPLGNRKPSDLIAAMLESCQRGEEKTDLFACLFLQRLPLEIRILLADADHKDPKLLAEKADQLWGHHSIEAGGISVVQEDDGLVAAMRSDHGGGRGRGGRIVPAPLAVRRPTPWVRAALRVAGKHRRQGQLSAVAPRPLLRLTDGKTKLRFLVDTGASFSVLPHSSGGCA
jgi:hypothetical protein